MGRLTFPDEGSRLLYDPVSGKLLAAGTRVALYLDADATQPATDLLSSDGTTPITVGYVASDVYRRVPLFQGPASGVDTLYAVVGTGPVTPIYARTDDRLDTLAARVAAVESTTAVESVNEHPGPAVTVTKADVGLGNADNTPDTAKPVSTAQAAALAAKADLVGGKVPTSQLPAVALDQGAITVTSAAARYALVLGSTIEPGQPVVQASTGQTFILAAGATDPSQPAAWLEIPAIGKVQTVNGQQGAVVLAAADVGAQPADPDLTAIAALDSAQAGALATDGGGWFRKSWAQVKTALGITTADVAGLGTAATHPATDFDVAGAATSAVAAHVVATDPHADRAYTDAKVAALVNSAPAILDTLGELATQMQSDESAATALATTVAGKQNVVVHGATAATARPAGATLVHWVGSVAPTNAATNDEWTDTANKVMKRWTGTAWDSLGASSDLPDRTSATSETVPVSTTTNATTAGVTLTAPALLNPVGSPPQRFSVRNASAGPITVSYPVDPSGATTLLMVLPGEVLTFRQKSTSGWAAESGNKPLAQLDARFMYGLALGRGRCVVPVGPTCGLYGQFQSNGTDANVNYRVFLPLSDPKQQSVLPVFANQPNFGAIGDAAPPNPITIAAAVELSDGTVVPFTFNGQHTVTITSGYAIADYPINFGAQVADGNVNMVGLTGVVIRTTVTVAASRGDSVTTTSGSPTVTDAAITAADKGRRITGTGIPANTYVGTVTPGTTFLLSSKPDSQVNVNATASGTVTATLLSYIPLNHSGYANGIKAVTSAADLTLEGSAAGSSGFGGSNAAAYGPVALLGVPTNPKPIIASLTDSIFYGTTDSGLGPVARACAALGYGHVKLSKVSETAGSYTTPAGRKYRMTMVPGCTHAVIELGTNDGVDTTGKATLLQASLTTLLTYLTGLGIKCVVATVPPKGLSSTDGYATAAGQTPYNSAAGLAQINTWIRGGCGGLSAGTLEMNDILSTARDSGIWLPHARGRHLTDLATTSGSNIVTSASAAFTSADIGLGLFVTGVYTNSVAIINTVTDAQTVTITNGLGGAALNAGSTVSGAVGGVGSFYSTGDGTHPSTAMMQGAILTNTTAALAALAL